MSSILDATLAVVARLLNTVPGVENVTTKTLRAGPTKVKGRVQTRDFDIIITVRKRK